jgi:hypothetical protein
LLFMCRLSAQIDLNTNFDILSNQPIDNRTVIDNLSDTTSLTWVYEGLSTYVKGLGQFWVYNGSFWEELTSDNLATADQTLTGARTVTTAGNTLSFNNGSGSGDGDAVSFSKDIYIGSARLGIGSNALSTNVLFGNGVGANLTQDVDNGNVFIGDLAGTNQAGASKNVFVGQGAGQANIDAEFLTFVGYHAGYGNTTGQDNSAYGYGALEDNATGQFNTASGYFSLGHMLNGSENVAYGWGTGNGSVANPNTGSQNLFIGYQTGQAYQSGNRNTFIGYESATTADSTFDNTTLGYYAGRALTDADNATLLGSYAGQNLTSGIRNTFVGSAAGGIVTTGENNTLLGANINTPNANTSNYLGLGIGNGTVKAQNMNNLWYFSDRVGIQKQVPISALDVSGNGSNNIFNAAFDSTGTSAFININRYNGTGIDLKWGNTEDRFTARLVDVSHDLQFISATSADPALTILNANRYIGIGTSSPDSNLEVEAVAVDAHVNQIKITQASWSASQNKHKSIVWDDKTNPLAGIGVSFDGSDAYMDWHSFYNGGYTGDANILMRLKGNGQLGIGTTTPSPSAKLEISSTTQGFLPPRMTTTQRDAISSPAAGLIIFNTTTSKHQGYDGTTWNDMY